MEIKKSSFSPSIGKMSGLGSSLSPRNGSFLEVVESLRILNGPTYFLFSF